MYVYVVDYTPVVMRSNIRYSRDLASLVNVHVCA